MKSYLLHMLSIIGALLISSQSPAFTAGNWWSGIGYHSENALNEVANDASGKTGLLGTASYPFIFRYDLAIGTSWIFAPQLNYTLLPRKTKGHGAEVTLTHFIFNFGQNTSTAWDWSFGPGILRETIKGKGGTTVLNNGNSTSTFANPGRTVTIQKVTVDVATGYTSGKIRYGIDLYFIAPFSSKERTQNLMFSFTYNFSGSGSDSGGMFK